MAIVTTPYDEYWFEPLVPRYYQMFVYVVYWPKTRVIKAGFTTYPKRWRKFCRRGALLLAVMPGRDVRTESLLAERFAAIGKPAFKSWSEAISHLGAGGSGYTECYRLSDTNDLSAALDYMQEVDGALV